MKKRFVYISAAFMMAFSLNNVSANETEAPEKIVFDKEMENNVSSKRIEELNKEAKLDLSEKQKKELSRAMLAYREAQINLRNEFNQNMYEMEAGFQKNINDVLTMDQRDSFEEYLKGIQEEHKRVQKEKMEKAQKEWEQKIKEIQKNN